MLKTIPRRALARFAALILAPAAPLAAQDAGGGDDDGGDGGVDDGGDDDIEAVAAVLRKPFRPFYLDDLPERLL